jgi:hypothetical protein
MATMPPLGLSSELEEQSFSRELAEANAQALRQERDDLLQKLRCAQRAQMLNDMQVRTLTNNLAEARRQLGGEGKNSAIAAPATLEEIVKSLVTFELEGLRNCSQEERVATKRRLLLRWHPDKNSSSGVGGADMATRVVQDLGQRMDVLNNCSEGGEEPAVNIS